MGSIAAAVSGADAVPLVSLIVSVLALLLTLRTVRRDTWRNEIDLLNRLTGDYQCRLFELEADPANELRLWRLINCVEQLCAIDNHGLASRRLREPITEIVTDFITGLAHSELDHLIDGIGLGKNAYREIRRFSHRHRRVIGDKLARLQSKPRILAAARA